MTGLTIKIKCNEGTSFSIKDGDNLSTDPNSFPDDKSHFHSLYMQIQRMAAAHPNEVINIEYGGGVIDGHLDLQNLINCFSKHPQLLPKNVKLQFTDETKTDKPVPFNIMICGTGGIDTKPADTLTALFPTLKSGTDCANDLYKKSSADLNLQRSEISPGVDTSQLAGKTVPIRTREDAPQNFVPQVVQEWVSKKNPSVTKIVMHMQSAMNPPHPGHIQMLLATVDDIAKKAAAKGEKVEVMVVGELAPEWYLQSKLALTSDPIRKQFSFETRKKMMTYLSHELVPAQAQALKEANSNLVDVQFVVNPDPIIFDHPDRVKQMQQELTPAGVQVISVQGIDSHAWTFEQLAGLSFISLTRGGDFPKERAELEKKIQQATLSNSERIILQAILEFNHELSVFSSSKLMSLKDQEVVTLMQTHSPVYTEFFLKKLESKIAKALEIEDVKKVSAIEAVKGLFVGRGKTEKVVSLDKTDENTRKFLLQRLEKHLEKISGKIARGEIVLPTTGPQAEVINDLLQLVKKQKDGELKGDTFKVFLGEVKGKLESIMQAAEPSPLKEALEKKIERDPFLRVILQEEKPQLSAAARAAGP